MNDEQNWLLEAIRQKTKKRAVKIGVSMLGSMLPMLLIIFAIVILGSGVFGAFSMVGGFLDGIHGKSDMETLKNEAARLNDLTEEEILELVKSDKIDASFYETMMISKEEFQYLLEQVMEYNAQDVSKTIEIECRHTYTEWIEDETLPEGGYSEQVTEYPYREITVRSADIEKFYLDWQLVYALCLTDTMSGVEDWTRTFMEGSEEGAKGTLIHYGTDHEEIDYIISNVRMNYEYVTDLARSPKDKYTMQ